VKLIRLTVTIFFSINLFFTHVAAANECEVNEDHRILLCGDWTKPEIDELMTFLIGDEEIHKIIKKNENYYLLHTCKERTNDSICMRGFVYVIERSDGGLVVRPEGWDWFSP
jgi:hypothetical protein